MFNSSLRRAVRPYPTGTLIASRPTISSVSAFSSHSHQRRHSSSKPPVPPNNGSSTLPAASVKQVGAPRTESKKSSSESRLSKRSKVARDKADSKEETQENWTSHLPSVASLQHLNPKDVYVASFFSTHRPISITAPYPPDSQINDIDKIFQPKSTSKSKTNPADIIYTLSSAVENLDEQIAAKQSQNQSQNSTQRADIIKALTQHNDHAQATGESSPSQQFDGQQQGGINVRTPSGNVKIVIQELTRRFRPFNVPPAPVPVTEIEIEAVKAAIETDPALHETDIEASTAENLEDMQAKVLEVQIEQQDTEPQISEIILNVEESSNLEHGNFFTSNESTKLPIGDVTTNNPVSEPITQQRQVGRRRRPGQSREMFAISVKRQRRLKMKKHKYKKLMRKTRNLRRRLDKL